MKKIRLAAACILLLSAMVLQGCSGNDHGLDPDKPITLTLWHYYSGSQKQAFDELVYEFNETQGKNRESVWMLSQRGVFPTSPLI